MWKMSTWNALKANWNFINGKIIAFDWCITMLVISRGVERSSVWSAVLPLVPCHSLKVRDLLFSWKRGKLFKWQENKDDLVEDIYLPSAGSPRREDVGRYWSNLRGKTYRMYRITKSSIVLNNIDIDILIVSYFLCLTWRRRSRHGRPPQCGLCVAPFPC